VHQGNGEKVDIYVVNKNTNEILHTISTTTTYNTRDYSTVDLAFDAETEYYLRVSSASGGNIPYELAVTTERKKDVFLVKDGNEVEYNNETQYANFFRVLGSTMINGTIANSSDQDYFTFVGEVNKPCEFRFYPLSSGDFFIFLCDMKTGEYIKSGTVNQYDATNFQIQEGHQYKIFVSNSSGNDSKYLLYFAN